MSDEMEMLREVKPAVTDPSDLDTELWRTRLMANIVDQPVAVKRRPKRRMVSAVAIGVAITLGGAAAAASVLWDEEPNPGEPAALSLDVNAATLVVEPGPRGQTCIATRADRGRGSVCSSADSTEVLVGYSVSPQSFALGVFDPLQRAVVVVADGIEIEPVVHASDSGEFTYFGLVGVRLPDEIQVLSSDGSEIAVLRPADDHRAASGGAIEAD